MMSDLDQISNILTLRRTQLRSNLLKTPRNAKSGAILGEFQEANVRKLRSAAAASLFVALLDKYSRGTPCQLSVRVQIPQTFLFLAEFPFYFGFLFGPRKITNISQDPTMKLTLVFVLLVVSLYTVCGELAETSAVLASSQSRRLQEVVGVSGAGVEEVKNTDGIGCNPIPYVDFGFERLGEEFVPPKKGVGAAACLRSCPSDIGCVALNYYPDTRICATLQTVTEVKAQPKKLSSTLLIVFEKNYVCDPGNFIPGYHRVGHD